MTARADRQETCYRKQTARRRQQQDRTPAARNCILQELSSCWDGRRFGHNSHGPESRAAVPICIGGGAGFLSNTMWPGPRPIPPYRVASWSI